MMYVNAPYADSDLVQNIKKLIESNTVTNDPVNSCIKISGINEKNTIVHIDYLRHSDKGKPFIVILGMQIVTDQITLEYNLKPTDGRMLFDAAIARADTIREEKAKMDIKQRNALANNYIISQTVATHIR